MQQIAVCGLLSFLITLPQGENLADTYSKGSLNQRNRKKKKPYKLCYIESEGGRKQNRRPNVKMARETAAKLYTTILPPCPLQFT